MSEKFVKVLIYGDDSVASRNFLKTLRGKFSLVEDIVGKEMSDEDVEVKIYTQSMFATDKKLVVIEGVPKDKYLSQLMSVPQNIALWIEGKPTAAVTKLVKNFVKKEFNEEFPVNAFTFVNKFFSRDLYGSLAAYEVTLEKKIVFEVLIGALDYRLRQLISLKKQGTISSLPAYQIKRLEQDGNKWSVTELDTLYKDLAALDANLKGGHLKVSSAFTQLLYQYLISPAKLKSAQ